MRVCGVLHLHWAFWSISAQDSSRQVKRLRCRRPLAGSPRTDESTGKNFVKGFWCRSGCNLLATFNAGDLETYEYCDLQLVPDVAAVRSSPVNPTPRPEPRLSEAGPHQDINTVFLSIYLSICNISHNKKSQNKFQFRLLKPKCPNREKKVQFVMSQRAPHLNRPRWADHVT